VLPAWWELSIFLAVELDHAGDDEASLGSRFKK